MAVMPSRRPSLPDRAEITSPGASSATLMMFTPFSRYGTPIRPMIYCPYWCSRSLSVWTELPSRTMTASTATRVSIDVK